MLTNQSMENTMKTIGEYIISTGEVVELLQNEGEFGVKFLEGATVWFLTMEEMFDFVERY